MDDHDKVSFQWNQLFSNLNMSITGGDLRGFYFVVMDKKLSLSITKRFTIHDFSTVGKLDKVSYEWTQLFTNSVSFYGE